MSAEVRKEIVRIDVVPQSLYSEGIQGLKRYDQNTELFSDIDHVIYKDYVNNNIIHVWITDQEDEYTNATTLMEYLVNNVFGDFITRIYNILTDEKNVLILVDCLGGLSPEVDINDSIIKEQDIDVNAMSDMQIISILTSHKSSFEYDDDEFGEDSEGYNRVLLFLTVKLETKIKLEEIQQETGNKMDKFVEDLVENYNVGTI